MAANLKQIRQQISQLTAERAELLSATPPVEVLEQKLRAHLAALASPLDAFIDSCAHVLNGGDPAYTTPATPPMLARAGFGMNLTPDRIEAIVATAKAKAEQNDAGQLRLTDSEKVERIADIDRRLYQAGLDEQAFIGDEEQRREVNAACVLGIPLEAAIEFELV